MSEKDHGHYKQLRDRLSPFGVEDIKVQLIATVPGLEIEAVETLFYVADTVGYEVISELFFALRELLRQLENPNSRRDMALAWIEDSLREYDKVTEELVKPRNLKREEITEGMLKPGSISLELARLERHELRPYLEEMFRDMLETTLDSTQAKIAQELTTALQNENLDQEDITAVLKLLGIEKIEGDRIVIRPEILQNPEATTTHNQRILEIGGSLSRKWQEQIWLNPMFDVILYQKLRDFNFKGENAEEAAEMLAEHLPLNDLLSLINGESLVDDRLSAAVAVFLDRVAGQLQDLEKLQIARSRLDELLSDEYPNRQEIYQILLSLLTDSL
jgi:hypothetical protein